MLKWGIILLGLLGLSACSPTPPLPTAVGQPLIGCRCLRTDGNPTYATPYFWVCRGSKSSIVVPSYNHCRQNPVWEE
jgi:hypothetical protein